MAYSIIEQQSLDLDIFFKDNEKHVHLASAGGLLPKILAENDTTNDAFSLFASSLPDLFEVDINPNLEQMLNILSSDLEAYLFDFVKMARKGFYSYDKTRIGDPRNKLYHLVVKPKDQAKLHSIYYQKVLSINKIMPSHFKAFDLFDICRK